MLFTLSLEVADLLHELRQHCRLSQEKLAFKLGVSFRTVNRWENRHSVPSHLALKQIKGLLQEMSHSSKMTERQCGQDLLAKYFQE
ncbi:MAG: helix-turn-helix domain-containing protein [Oculatellaceae cyanobacterium Prado106]|jgi:DNA-binding transcriptional regulator YiaG|nr:helix-turn-helix domain-containing protein [Oculatellaceae cyanobacterium Prado106]